MKKTEYRDNYIKIGLKIQYYRKLRGYTQEKLAELVDMSWSFIAKIEAAAMVTGISLETLFKIAEALGIEPYKLLKED